ncbi:MAG: hypothetical protein AAGN66_05085 [Acidobacteriota bacterium]
MKLKGTAMILGTLLVLGALAAPPAGASWVEMSYDTIDGIYYVGVLCSDGLQGGGTFLSLDDARVAAHEYCSNNSL